MLNRTKLIRELQTVSDELFQDYSHEHELARAIWQQITADQTFTNKIRGVSSVYPLPTWQGALDEIIPVERGLLPYRVFSVDGSQIYPDKHQGTTCFLVNTGKVALAYGVPGESVMLDSEPQVFVSLDSDSIGITTELVNCKRQELEFTAGLEVCTPVLEANIPSVFLCDGSLIFWHLESKDGALKEQFLGLYLEALHQFYLRKQLIAGYISLPKAKEVVNLLRVVAEEPEKFGYDVGGEQESASLNHIVDTAIASFFLTPYSRSIVFKNHASITKNYPEHLHPHFFYLHVGDEIGRVEIPAWIAQDEAAVDTIARIILDQSIKGRGYPVALAEAHEQAVVKGPDREFFYQLICKFGMERKRRMNVSQKSLKKRGIGI